MGYWCAKIKGSVEPLGERGEANYDEDGRREAKQAKDKNTKEYRIGRNWQRAPEGVIIIDPRS